MSYRYFSAGKEHLDELRRADGDALDAYFHARIAEYNHAYRHDELVPLPRSRWRDRTAIRYGSLRTLKTGQ